MPNPATAGKGRSKGRNYAWITAEQLILPVLNYWNRKNPVGLIDHGMANLLWADLCHYLHIVNAHNASTVIHVLLQVFFLRIIQQVKKELEPIRPLLLTIIPLTRYSKTSVRHLSVWIMSWSVTILACFKSFSRDTRETTHHTVSVKQTTSKQIDI